MPTLVEHIAARIARIHAQRTHARFLRALEDVTGTQQRVLRRVLALLGDSEFARRHGLAAVRTPADLARAIPVMTYEDYRPYVDRVCAGDTQALFAPGRRVLMLATTSGTTAAPKRIPVTDAFLQDYRRGWNVFGLKLLTDHPAAILRPILQCTGRHDAERTAAGLPCGAITGMLADMQKGIVRRFYVGRPEVAHLENPQARYYTLMRLGVERDVAFAVTANPSTLIQMAKTADEHSEAMIRDVRDGTLSAELVADEPLRRRLAMGLRRNAARAEDLQRLRATRGRLKPQDYWRLEFLACWTGGSMGHYLGLLADWWGRVPVRDIGLLASEGRVSIPFADGTPVGVLDVTSAAFEFIPVEQAESTAPECLGPQQIEPQRSYVVVLTNAAGLVRYRLDDVVRVHGWLGMAPLVEFLHRVGRVSSVAGEKLTENQVAAAVSVACQHLRINDLDFVLAPRWADPPHYLLTVGGQPPGSLGPTVDDALAQQNEEYASRRKSGRLGPLRIRSIESGRFEALDRRLIAARRGTADQYKRPCLFTAAGEDDTALQVDGAR